MKTLKKVLSVALVIAMAFSLVTMVGAAGTVAKYQDFTDADAIVNKEAVDTLVGLGVINGMDDGSYAPNGHFTRAQASKIIAYLLLGENVAASLRATTAPFADVAATHWAAPFIQFCVTRGILNGVGDNKFDPEGSVTAAQFAKMLLTAAGYGKKGEYVGADWAINTIVDAQNVGILDTGVDYMAPATRDEVARYAFNFFANVDFVNFSKDEDAYKTNEKGTLAEQQDVEPSDSIYVNGVLSHKWLKKGLDLTKNYWPDNDIRVVYTYSDGTALYNLTTRGQFGYKAPLDAGVAYFLNGEEITVAEDLAALKGKLGVVANSRGTLGLVVSLVDENRDGDIDMVLVIEKSVGTLTNDPYVSPAGAVTIAGIGISGAPDDSVVGYQGLKKGDVVLYYTDNEGVTHIEKARSVSGQLTQGNASAITFGGARYSLSGLVSASYFTNEVVGLRTNFNVDAMIWLDNANGVVKFKTTGTAPTLPTGVLVGYRHDAFTGTAVAKIAKEDGIVATYSVAPNVYGVAPDQTDDFLGLVVEEHEGEYEDLPYGYLVTYVLDDQGRVTLYPVNEETNTGVLGAAYGAKSSVVSIEVGEAAAANYYITGTTKVFYFDTTKPYNTTPGDDFNIVSVTTGYAATDDVDDETPVSFLLAETSTATTKVLRTILFAAAGTPTSDNYKYVFTTMYSGFTKSYDSFGNAVYYYNVYEGDEMVTLKARTDDLFELVPVAGFPVSKIYKVLIDAQGYATVVDEEVGRERIEEVNKETVLVQAGYVATETGVVITNANTKFYLYDASNYMAPVVAGAVEGSTDYLQYTITYVLKDKDGVAERVYYTQHVGLRP